MANVQAQRNAKKKGRLKTCPPRTALSFTPLRWPQREEGNSHLDTNRGKQKPSHLLLPLPPCLAAAPCPQPTVGSLFWSPEPRRPCSLGAQTQAGKGGDGVPRPPCSVPNLGQNQPTHTSPKPSQEPGAVPAMEGTTSGHTPGQWNHAERVKGKVKGSWRPPELPEAPGGPATLHCASLLSSLILLPPKRALAWKQDTQSRSQLSGPVASPLNLGVLCALDITSPSDGCCHQDWHRGPVSFLGCFMPRNGHQQRGTRMTATWPLSGPLRG